jgi:hypothetical protein
MAGFSRKLLFRTVEASARTCNICHGNSSSNHESEKNGKGKNIHMYYLVM